ncbi:MAG: FHA domain-containing protein [Clostridia bacterium]|nr:FHA domain-containing protein [Clostridia bacterium]
MDYCEENGLDSDDQYVLQTWLSQNYDKYADKMDEYSTYNDKASQAFYYAYEDEFDGDEDDIKATMDNIQRISTGLWSGLIALFIGLFLGLGEGIYYGSFEKAVIYALIGAGISILIGTISGYCAQWMYASLLSEDSSDIVKALVRALGWAIMGVGVGLSVGLIKPDANRIAFCTLGGVIGAFVGGFLFNYIFELVPHDIVARGIAIVIMGLLIGVGVGLLEQFAKSAWLKVIRGEFEGKEYLVFKGVTSIGNSGKNMVVLFKDKLVAPNHCDIVQEGSKYVLVDKGSPMGTVVNGMRINRHVLRAGDAISIGNSVLIFNTK